MYRTNAGVEHKQHSSPRWNTLGVKVLYVAQQYLLQKLCVDVVEGVVAEQHQGLRGVERRQLAPRLDPRSVVSPGSLRRCHLHAEEKGCGSRGGYGGQIKLSV